MLDIFARNAAVQVTASSLGASTLPSPLDQVTAIAVEAAHDSPGSALLGALVDKLLAEAELGAREIEILTAARVLFSQGRDVVKRTEGIRATIEAVVKDPSSPTALTDFNGAAVELQQIQKAVQTLSGDLKSFQATLTPDWLGQVGQQQDKPVDGWSWRDIFLGRRTGAFAAEVLRRATASGDKQELAFALGVVAGETGSAVGNAFLNHVVGGPRRSHQSRHRLAEYSVGAWFRDNATPITGSLATIRNELGFGQSNARKLPARLKVLIEATLRAIYPSGVPAVPDLDLGYANLLRHIELLQGFALPPLPNPIDAQLTQSITQAGLLNAGIHTQSGGTGPDDPTPSPHEPDPPGVETGPKDNKNFCDTVLEILGVIGSSAIAFALILIFGETPSQGQTAASSSAALETWAASEDALAAVSALYNGQCEMWTALATSLTALQLLGLLYPGPDDMTDLTFAQFVTITSIGKDTPYPHRAVPVSAMPTVFPASPLEHPTTIPSPFAVGATPVSFLNGMPAADVATLSIVLWEGDLERENLNLDADRGWLAVCWKLVPGTSINTDPLRVLDLEYSEI